MRLDFSLLANIEKNAGTLGTAGTPCIYAASSVPSVSPTPPKSGDKIQNVPACPQVSPNLGDTETPVVIGVPNVPIVPAKKASNANEAEIFRRFLLHYPGGHIREMACSPAMTLTEARAAFPDAQAVEPAAQLSPVVKKSLTADQLETLHTWFAFIGETDQTQIAEIVDLCERDIQARFYYLARGRDIQEQRREAYQERAAIMEYDGGLSRAEAERRTR